MNQTSQFEIHDTNEVRDCCTLLLHHWFKHFFKVSQENAHTALQYLYYVMYYDHYQCGVTYSVPLGHFFLHSELHLMLSQSTQLHGADRISHFASHLFYT